MIGRWLADTWEGSVVKIALGAATIPVVVNALNRDDPRYGVQAYVDPEDIARETELEIEGE